MVSAGCGVRSGRGSPLQEYRIYRARQWRENINCADGEVMPSKKLVPCSIKTPSPSLPLLGRETITPPPSGGRLGGGCCEMSNVTRNQLEELYIVRYNVQKSYGGAVCKDYEFSRISGQCPNSGRELPHFLNRFTTPKDL